MTVQPTPGNTTQRQVANPHPALAYACPFCGAAPTQQCHTRQNEHSLRDCPHSRRMSLVPPRAWAAWRKTRSPQQALCCRCGALNTGTPENPRGYWGDPNWHRALADLECNVCGRQTTHALIERYEADRDADEQLQHAALGGVQTPRGWLAGTDGFARVYRQGNLPRNPYLLHRYWIPEARERWDAGERTINALCGETMALEHEPELTPSPSAAGLIKPDVVRDMEYEDAATALSWVDMECVDCLRVANHYRLKKQRRLLREQLWKIARHLDELDATTVTELREAIDHAGVRPD